MSFNSMLTAPRYPAPVQAGPLSSKSFSDVPTDPQVLMARSVIDLSQKAKHAVAKSNLTQALCNKLKSKDLKHQVAFPPSPIKKHARKEEFKRSISSPLPDSFWTDSWLNEKIGAESIEVQGQNVSVGTQKDLAAEIDPTFPSSPSSCFSFTSTERSYTYF